MTECSAVILAGGKSSRMGQKKATLALQGKSFLDIIIDKLSEVGIDEIMLSGYEDPRLKYVEDIYQDRGPLAGIHAGLCCSESNHVLVLTEDAPLIPAGFICKLIEEHKKGVSPITVASSNGRVQQLLGVYEKSLSPICEELLQGQRQTVMSLIDRVGCVQLPFDGDEILIRGCNTPEEYQALVSRFL